MFKEFKEFIMRGNVLELAIGVVMGSAFTAIVNSLVEDIIGPIIAAVSGSADVSDMTVAIGPAELGVGSFLQAIIDFLIIAIILFIIVKSITSVSDRFSHEEETEEEPIPSAEELLVEIKDILKEERQSKVINGTPSAVEPPEAEPDQTTE